MFTQEEKIFDYLIDKVYDSLENYRSFSSYKDCLELLTWALGVRGIAECTHSYTLILYSMTLELLSDNDFDTSQTHYNFIYIEKVILEVGSEEIVTEFINRYLPKNDHSSFVNLKIEKDVFLISKQHKLREDFIVNIIADKLVLEIEIASLQIKLLLQQSVPESEWYRVLGIDENDEDRKNECKSRLYNLLGLNYY